MQRVSKLGSYIFLVIIMFIVASSILDLVQVDKILESNKSLNK